MDDDAGHIFVDTSALLISACVWPDDNMGSLLLSTARPVPLGTSVSALTHQGPEFLCSPATTTRGRLFILTYHVEAGVVINMDDAALTVDSGTGLFLGRLYPRAPTSIETRYDTILRL
ncbi:hypothetical protein CPB85DRAFT_1440814 [Mucidula mucida]|nr:hypothetical protein CPB85DRAFT_1440814 [Mucidula mucida]